MKRIAAYLAAGAAALSALSACNQMPTQNQAIGTGVGAVGGYGAGRAMGGTRGGNIGAGLGAVFGYLIGSRIGVTEQADGSVKLDIPSALLFDFDSTTLSPSFAPTLDSIASTLNGGSAADTVVTVLGHTDSTGSDDYNLNLSRLRAASVASALRSRGVAAARLQIEGRGEAEPIASNQTADGRARNRRVEMIVSRR